MSSIKRVCWLTEIVYAGNQGGLSNGEIINMRIAFKPTATIGVSLISPLLCLLHWHVHGDTGALDHFFIASLFEKNMTHHIYGYQTYF